MLEKEYPITLQFGLYVYNEGLHKWDLYAAHEDIEKVLYHARRILENNEFGRLELCCVELESGYIMRGRHFRKKDTP